MITRFHDRRDAGRRLAARLSRRSPREGLVLGLARGGVPVAYEIAAALELPLDVFVVRKEVIPGAALYRLAGRGTSALQASVPSGLKQ